MSLGIGRSIFACAVYSEIFAGKSTTWHFMPKDIPLAIQLTDCDGNLPGSDFAQFLATDCKCLFDLCNRPTSTLTEKRINLDFQDVREHFDRDEDVLVSWVRTTAMLVDSLTKRLAGPTVLKGFLSSNQK